MKGRVDKIAECAVRLRQKWGTRAGEVALSEICDPQMQLEDIDWMANILSEGQCGFNNPKSFLAVSYMKARRQHFIKMALPWKTL